MADNLETELARLIREEVRRQLADSGVAVKDRPAGPAKLLGNPEAKAFLLGATVALAGAALWPSIKPALKPALASAMQTLNDFSDKIRTGFAEAQESLSDLVAEARFEKEQAEQGRAVPATEPPQE